MVDHPFARRTNWHQGSNAVFDTLEELRIKGVDVLDLTASNPTTCGFDYPQGMLSLLSSPDHFNYAPEACGMLTAREAVGRHYSRQQGKIPAENIVLTASTSEAYSFLLRLLVNSGEKVLIPRPSYPLFQFLLEINDVRFDQYPLIYEGKKWHIDRPALERLAAQGKPKAIILVNPNNPTGSYISRGELDFLNELCRKHSMALISDEVFYDFALDKGDWTSVTGNQAVLTFVLGGLSKTLALPQMKCAWIITSGPSRVTQEALSRLEIIADTYLSVNTPVQNALGSWLGQAAVLQEQIISRVKENYQWLKEHVSEDTELLALSGGWSATLRIPAVKSEEAWVLDFIREEHVSVYPGYFFDFGREAYIVLSLIVPRPIFQEAAGRIIRRLAKI